MKFLPYLSISEIVKYLNVMCHINYEKNVKNIS